MHATYPATIRCEDNQRHHNAVLSALDTYNHMFNTAARKLYVDWIIQKKDINTLKKDYQTQWGLNARQFNSMRIELQGKVDAVLELNKSAIVDTERHIKKLQRDYHYHNGLLPNLRNHVVTDADKETVTKKTTKVMGLKSRLAQAESKRIYQLDIEKTGNPHLCFGSKKLFHQQFLIDESHSNHAQSVFESRVEWRSHWLLSRHRTFMLVGSRDETTGNQNCQLRHLQDDTFELKVNLYPKAVSLLDRYTTMTIQIHHGVDYIQECLNKGEALTYRFHKGSDGSYRVLISLDRSKQAPAIATMPKAMGCIGIDINAAHISVAETDRFGNFITRFDIPVDCKDKTSDQTKDIISLAVKDIIKFAKDVDKPIVVEDLDFVAKKKTLTSGVNKKYNAMLSSFAYNRILSNIKARALDHGIEVIDVNPAYTSMIGKYKYQGHRKLTTHQSAAYVIARRGMYSIVHQKITKNKTFTKRIINKENRIAARLQKHYPFVLPEWNTQGTRSASFWKAMQSAETKYRNKTRRNSTTVDPIDGGGHEPVNVDSC